MGMFDGWPVLGEIEDGLGAGFDAVAEATTDIVEAAADAADFVAQFIQDPVGAVEGALDDISFSDLVDVVGLGLDDLAGDVLSEAGLGPLVDGVSAFVDKIDEVVAAVLQGLKCLHWLDVPMFWTMVGGLFGARAAGLVSSKDDCRQWVERGELAALVANTQVPLLSMLPCAIEAAFLTPLPSGTSAPLGNDTKARATKNLQSGKVAAAAAVVGDKGLMALALSSPPEVMCVSRSEGKLDVMVTRDDGASVSAAWEEGRDTAWRGWWPIAGGRAHPGTPITAVSRSADKLDVFMVGLDSRVWTAAWEPGQKDWKGWWSIGNLRLPSRQRIQAVCKRPDHLDVFARGFDGAAYTAAWEAGRDTAWRGWWRLT